MKDVLIIGAGIIGLSTAIRLQEAGYQVNILTKDFPLATTSAKAGAIWFPFKAEPKDLVNKWSRITYDHFVQQKNKDIQGISMVDFIMLTQKEEAPYWEKAIPSSALRKATSTDLPKGYQHGYVAKVPLIEPPKYLPYLLNIFHKNGGQIEQRTLQNLEEIHQSNQILINCTGLGSQKLANDTSLYPIQGHLAKVALKENVKCISDDDGPQALSYVFPRKDVIVLGGTAVDHQYNEAPSSAEIQQLIHRCEQIEPAIQGASILETTVGLRPGRPTIRLEKNPDGIIHHYGHGGSGYTLCWGCAEAVVGIIEC